MTKYLFIVGAFIFISCQQPQKTFILISKDYNSNIQQWLTKADPKIETRIFYDIPSDSMEYFLTIANGMVLGGGEDVNPLVYNKPEYDSICEGYDNYRDSIELLMIHFAMKNKTPIFGICRGLQILNAGNGGTLIPDIPTFYPQSQLNHRIKTEYAHASIATKDGWLTTHFNVSEFQVNSRHHQSIDSIAPGFKVAAHAPDGVIESIQWTDSTTHPFAVGVQWHPEALNDSLSMQIANLFLQKVAK
ncbi:MAG: gamma-glutamyl-gamma-aminobutyrate hydrolase family protein [Salinivirgaceae bacterium]